MKILSPLALFATVAFAGPLDETRICGAPKHDAQGHNVRRADVIAAFKKAHPCPANGKTTGACAGWIVDHVIPLEMGGCDSVPNLQWMPTADAKAKDKWEMKAYPGKESGGT